MTIPLFAARPWVTDPIVLPGSPLGMLGPGEPALFYHLARDYFAGRGTIVDAGSFLGKSGFYFAQGLRANPRFEPRQHRVHCYDIFRVNDELTVRFLRRAGVEAKIGDSTRPLFDRQVQTVRDVLEVHEGDFHAETWRGGPIEILMVDVAKSLSLWRNVLAQMFPALVPGTSLVAHQDYHHVWLPFLHVVMEDLADHFEIVVPRVDGTCVFRLLHAIPDSALQRAIAYDYSRAERQQLMARAIARLPAGDRHHVQLAGLMMSAQDGAIAGLLAELDALAGVEVPAAERASWQASYARDRAAIETVLGLSAAWQRDWQCVVTIADRLLAHDPGDAEGVSLKASALLHTGRLGEAEALLREALRLAPESPKLLDRLAEVLRGQGRTP